MTCGQCGAELVIGSYPFCKGNPQDHDTIRSEWARRFDPPLVDINHETGQWHQPGSVHDTLLPGYERKSLDTLAQIEQFCSARSAEETAKRRDFFRQEKEYWDNRIRERREYVRAEMAKRGFKGKGFDAVTKLLDARRERNYDKEMRKEVHVFSDVLHFDSSNRESHSSAETGWKNRKA